MELVYRRHCDIAIVPLFCFPLRSKNKNTANKSENVHCYAMRCVKRYHIKHRIARSELANRWEKRINLLYRECVAALFMFNAFIHFESFCLLTCKTVASCICQSTINMNIWCDCFFSPLCFSFAIDNCIASAQVCQLGYQTDAPSIRHVKSIF